MSASCSRVDPLPGDLVRLHPGAEGELGQDRQLVGGVGPVDVERRVRPRRTQLLGLGQGRRRRAARRGVIAVRMKLQVPLTIAESAWTWLAARPTPSAWMIGIPPPTLPSKATARPCRRACGEDLGTVLGQHRLVGRHHVLARRQGGQHQPTGHVSPANRLDHDPDGRIGQDSLRVGGDRRTLGMRDRSHPLRVADQDPKDLQGTPRPVGDPVGRLVEQPRHARTDGPQAQQSDSDAFHPRSKPPTVAATGIRPRQSPGYRAGCQAASFLSVSRNWAIRGNCIANFRGESVRKPLRSLRNVVQCTERWRRSEFVDNRNTS